MIAYALVLRFPHEGDGTCKPGECISKEVFGSLTTTTLMLVYITTLLFGFFMKEASKSLTTGEDHTYDFMKAGLADAT